MRPCVRDERGQVTTLFVLMVLGALFATAGLVIDGGQKVTATTLAESVAAGAARAAGNAAATQQLGGHDPAGAAVLAAKAYLAGQPSVRGSASVSDGVVTVNTSSSADTVFLSALGIDTVTGTGSARASVVPTRRPR